ncbi:hypothetical protein EIP86_000806 [Pleurotus ostreatoroseus]|nr:hypothetical protein EIP86_000806 [Pleurotus ostreatoroseus]
MLFKRHFRRREAPWEVVDSKAVNPIPVWDEDEPLDVVRMHSTDMQFKFVHDVRYVSDLRKALQHAQHQLRQEAARQNYNIMIVEGWQLTIMRKGKKYRVEVVYSGRPAYATGKITALPPPPFMGMLDQCQKELHHHMPA